MGDEISVNTNINLGKGKTVDDILTSLREHLKRPEMVHTTHWDGCIESHTICALAWSLNEIERLREKVQDMRMYAEQDACEIERLRATIGGWSQDISNLEDEVERLKQLCDMLATRLRSGSDTGWDDAIDEWEDVREGHKFGDSPESQGSAKLTPNSETNVDETITSDSVKEFVAYLHELSYSEWLSDEDAKMLLGAANLLVNLQRNIGVKDGLLKGWDFMLTEAKEQAQQAHHILGSEPFVWVAGGTSNHEQFHWDALMPHIKKYWEKYGTVMRPRPL